MSYIPDALDMWERYDAEQQAQLNRLPKCSCCDEPIQEEYCYQINDEIICKHCMVDCFRKEVQEI